VSNTRRILAVTGLGLAASLAFASPAHAAVNALPASDWLYAVECEVGDGGFFSVDSTTAEFTAIGSGSASNPDVSCAGPSAFDFTTSTAYWISWQDSSRSALMTVDRTTGVSTTVAQFTEDGTGNSIEASSIAIDAAGNAFIIGRDTDADSNGNLLFSLDLATGKATFIAGLVDGLSNPIEEWWSFAFNAVDSTFYAISADSTANGGGIYSVDVSNGALTLIEDHDALPYDAYGITFDTDGALWGFADVGVDWGLFTADVNDPISTFTFVGVSTLDGAEYFSESIFMAPAPPALAATGATVSNVVPLAATLVVAGGVALALMARRRRTA
jgi:hypothetical protein